ncbi:MAG: hypothetical protein JWO73_50 [Candidatus Taylorbacteria bacterium]|nr:hypothetical protein [Candidatus Taylorbacteria bacterium]
MDPTKQQISPWTVIAIIGFLIFVSVLFYLSHKTQNIVENSHTSEKEQLIRDIK